MTQYNWFCIGIFANIYILFLWAVNFHPTMKEFTFPLSNKCRSCLVLKDHVVMETYIFIFLWSCNNVARASRGCQARAAVTRFSSLLKREFMGEIDVRKHRELIKVKIQASTRDWVALRKSWSGVFIPPRVIFCCFLLLLSSILPFPLFLSSLVPPELSWC